ncbi:MAG: TlpA family protein disulfide reductase [Lewinellaceae bacterium]|nr:TlpA family protein disulfide reductase [Lewinellaceae bacterium]HRW75140.1 TlpA disulfide reductase family protein [Saprospiraceae bacterium]
MLRLPFQISLFVGLLTLLSACVAIENPYPKLAPGRWRGVLQVDPSQSSRVGGKSDQQKERDIQFEEVTEGELPFEFDVIYDTPDSFHIVLINGEEEIIASDILFGLDRRTAKDTLTVNFPLYDSYLEAVCESGVMQGHWVVNYKENYRIPFVAKFGEGYRFTQLRKPPALDLAGTWAVTFQPGEPDAYPAIAEFAQQGNALTGTFRTETGDYRFLEGTVQANKLYLSCFDGAHAFLFEGKIMEDGSLIGSFRSGNHYQAYWTAQRDSAFTLADPDNLSRASDPDQPVLISFPDSRGNTVSLEQPEYAGRPVILQIMGTWCPNCLDETRFLRDYLTTHPDIDLPIISIAFERYRDAEQVLPLLERYRQRLDLKWPVLWGGYADKTEASLALPFLDGLKAYPTMVFLDREHRIQRIHTGFDGPATSKYKQFASDFHNFVNRLAGPSQ